MLNRNGCLSWGGDVLQGRCDNRLDTEAGQISQAILGKLEVIRLALVALLAEGHLLIEDAPGVGKTSLARAIAESIDGRWQRVRRTLNVSTAWSRLWRRKKACSSLRSMTPWHWSTAGWKKTARRHNARAPADLNPDPPGGAWRYSAIACFIIPVPSA